MLVRRHLVVAVALVLALATGVALGAGPLSHERLLPTTATPPPSQEPATDPGASADDLAESAAATLLGSRLDGRVVAVLSTPGADDGVVEDLVAGIREAEGSVVARWSAGRSLVSPREKTLIDTLGSQLLEQLAGGAAADDAVAYERMGQLVGRAIASPKATGVAADRDALTIRQSIGAASLLSGGGEESRLAPLLLVVLGSDIEDHVVADLVSGLSTRAAGVVVAAPAGARDLAVLDELGSVTTVDGVDGPAGRLAAVLALARADAEPGGSYGASGSDGMLPLG
ncbi:copper transporter [Nocardioides coralli]|uniref:copper transporter n=1 Tax=Nocardioides coralli TaxID=2872154 RepID=UPI0020179E0B|nr:copper transporter [Nocardioides coralli]